MKFKEIEIYLNEESQEFKEKVEELKNYCQEKGFLFSEGSYRSTDRQETKVLRIMVKDYYFSEEMKEIIAKCQEEKWLRGEAISKTSKNIFEAYQKAKKEYQEQKEYYSERQMAQKEYNLYLDLGRFREYLRGRIIKKVMEQYSRLGEKK